MEDPSERLRRLYIEEEKRRMWRIGLIVGGIIAAVIFIFAKEFLFPDRILFSLAFGWTVFNFAVYRGRYRPRIVFAVKTAYPLMLFILYLALSGK